MTLFRMQFRNNVGDSYSFLIALGNCIFIVKKSAEFQDIVQHILRAVKEKKIHGHPHSQHINQTVRPQLLFSHRYGDRCVYNMKNQF